MLGPRWTHPFLTAIHNLVKKIKIKKKKKSGSIPSLFHIVSCKRRVCCFTSLRKSSVLKLMLLSCALLLHLLQFYTFILLDMKNIAKKHLWLQKEWKIHCNLEGAFHKNTKHSFSYHKLWFIADTYFCTSLTISINCACLPRKQLSWSVCPWLCPSLL